MEYKEYVRRFRTRSTGSLIKGYERFNSDFRRIARDEFKKRRVAAHVLPYKKRKPATRGFFGIRPIGRLW